MSHKRGGCLIKVKLLGNDHCKRKFKLRTHNKSSCLIEVVTISSFDCNLIEVVTINRFSCIHKILLEHESLFYNTVLKEVALAKLHLSNYWNKNPYSKSLYLQYFVNNSFNLTVFSYQAFILYMILVFLTFLKISTHILKLTLQYQI